MEKIRIGIIGCGGIANGKHMPALHQLDDIEMVAFCDLIPERAEKAKADFGTPDAKVFTDYRELLADPSVEVVHVLTPNRAHSFITCDALRAGKHVMCEKPMAINSEEAKKMLDAANETGKLLTIGYQSRYRRDSMMLKIEAEKGTLGEIYYAKATALRRRAVPTWGVFMNEAEQGGGPLIDIGTHTLDLTLWIMDNYKPKYCVGTAYHRLGSLPEAEQGNLWGKWDPDGFTVEDSAFGFVVMENGATINLEASWALNILDTREATTLVCGTKAGGDLWNGVRLNGIRDGKMAQWTPDIGDPKSHFGFTAESDSESVVEARQWIDAVRGKGKPTVTPEQAYTVTRILEGIYKSAQSGEIYRF